jgi:hypothetical protein
VKNNGDKTGLGQVKCNAHYGRNLYQDCQKQNLQFGKGANFYLVAEIWGFAAFVAYDQTRRKPMKWVAQESCTVQYLGPGHLSGQWALHSSTGQVAQRGAWPEGRSSLTLEVGALAPGAYYWVVRTEAGDVAVRKAIGLGFG